MFCLACLILLWGLGCFFFSRNNLLYRLVPKCLGPLQSVSLFFTSVCLFVSQGIGEISDFIFSIKGE